MEAASPFPSSDSLKNSPFPFWFSPANVKLLFPLFALLCGLLTIRVPSFCSAIMLIFNLTNYFGTSKARQGYMLLSLTLPERSLTLSTVLFLHAPRLSLKFVASLTDLLFSTHLSSRTLRLTCFFFDFGNLRCIVNFSDVTETVPPHSIHFVDSIVFRLCGHAFLGAGRFFSPALLPNHLILLPER